MKIYNEVVSIFNEATGLWETTYEDSFNYSGPMAFMQGGLPPNASSINTSDTIADTRKTTTGYFTDGDGTLTGGDIFIISGSTTKPDNYFFNINQLASTDPQSKTQFAVSFAHYAGSGSDTVGDSGDNFTTLIGETKVIYNQLSHILLGVNEATGGFQIKAPGTRDDYIYSLHGKRERFKDRINKKAWTLQLSGSDASTTFTGYSFTDDSKYEAAVATPGGPRHNIVSGALGVHATGETYETNCFGWFYPEMGVMVFSGLALATLMPGKSTGQAMTGSELSAANNKVQFSGFLPNDDGTGMAKNHFRFGQCMQNVTTGTTFRLRSEEDQTQENYFCRIRAEQYNFSANPSFTSGSKNKIRNLDMHGDPQTFICGIGLYNSAGQLLAIAKLSKPLLKNFASEATIKVKLTY